MLFRVGDFVSRVESGLNTLVDELSNWTGRTSDAERLAWRQSLPKLSTALSDPVLEWLHVQIGPSAGIALEYRLPASSSWCDAVLLGRGKERPGVAILELKDWDVTGTMPGPRAGLIRHHNENRLHPSEQVAGYVEYCRAFHSVVQAERAEVSGCVFMTKRGALDPFMAAPHATLTTEYPLFNSPGVLASYLAERLAKPDEDFARAFVNGTYKQDRNFIVQVAKAITDPSSDEPQFVLLDGQREGYEKCLNAVNEMIVEMELGAKAIGAVPPKAAIIIEGPPGSGKSVLAARLWAAIAQDSRLKPQSVVFTTTSGSQRSNWEKTFRLVGKSLAGRGIVLPANRYNPGLTTTWVKNTRLAGHKVEIEDWRANLALFASSVDKPNIADNGITVAIVDEAHALIDPSRKETRGIPPSGWTLHAGPQAYHIMRVAQLSIFLMDGGQSYRDNETTRASDIEKLAADMGIPVMKLDLNASQFRCAGSKEYVDWLDSIFSLGAPRPFEYQRQQASTSVWRASGSTASEKLATVREDSATREGGFVFEMVGSPHDLELSLRKEMAKGYSVRLVASYAREWKTKGVSAPHGLPPELKDFEFDISNDTGTAKWSRIWNFAPAMDYTLFVQAPDDSAMHGDPLCEVGCPYVVRGFDYDFMGLLWLSDLVWRGGAWRTDIDHVFETAWPKSIKAAKDGHPEALETRVKRGYRILLSRAIRGVYVWCEDAETRDHLGKLLNTP